MTNIQARIALLRQAIIACAVLLVFGVGIYVGAMYTGMVGSVETAEHLGWSAILMSVGLMFVGLLIQEYLKRRAK